MSAFARASTQDRMHLEIEKTSTAVFEPKLRTLNLAEDQIEQQSLPELEASLVRVNDAIQHPDQFGTVRLKRTANANVVVTTVTAEAHIEMGVLPLLLERKSLILDRIKLLRPQHQILDLRQQISELVDDPTKRGELLRVLEKQEHEQEQFAERIETESRSVGDALKAERQAEVEIVAFTELRMKVDALDKLVESKIVTLEQANAKLEDKAVSKWDVATTVFIILAAIGGLIGATLGIVRWVTG